MSISLMSTAWKLDLSSTDKIVLLALADWSNDDGHCWPSLSQLQAKSGLSERAVRMAIGRLRDAGHLTRDERIGKGVVYTIHPGTSCPPASNAPRHEMPKTPARRAPNTSGTTKPQKATPSSGKRASKPTPKPSRVPSNFQPNVKPDSITGKAMANWPPGELEEQVEHFVDRHTTQGTTSLDWQASWRTWVKNWKKFNGYQPRRQMDGKPDLRGSRPDPSLDLLYAARAAEAEERAASGGQDNWGAWSTLPAIGTS